MLDLFDLIDIFMWMMKPTSWLIIGGIVGICWATIIGCSMYTAITLSNRHDDKK